MLLEIIKFLFFTSLIVLVSKYILVDTLRKLAENLNLKAKTVGNIAGFATSVPELLTIVISSIKGLDGVSIYNILSSNVINLVQYLWAIIANKNYYRLKNTAITTDIILVVLTIIIPIILLSLNIGMSLAIVPLFIILYAFFKFINNNIHKVYLQKEDTEFEEQVEKEKRFEKKNRKKTIKYSSILIASGIFLFIISEALGNTLQNLCNLFNIPQIIVGVLLGFVTSIPELITFFESQKHYKKNNSKNEMLGVVEATNNLLTSNIINLFIIQSIGIILTNFFK